ncbi:sulfatase [Rufibacter radiotolerans]|uniref:Sulfatase n=2 Tax=Rufibacter radiotolerans TaxID=1379910 RepID=A0A0H4VP21_9BACT|nr:sulfatase [Rufibacter radiotolerans]
MLRILFLFFAVSFAVQAQESKPNILWIVSEDNSPFIGAYGDTYATTPHIDKLASQGVLFTNAFSAAPVCAPARFTLITGMYASSMGTQQMRSNYPVPAFVKFFPGYLKQAGYYTSNNAKKDYNTKDQPRVWDESSDKATYLNRKPGQPFFAVFNIGTSHESQIHKPAKKLRHDPKKAPLPPYHPRTPEMEQDWALYYDKIEAMDATVGQLLQDLEKAGLADNTIVFYFSDHGGVLGRSKRFLYESGLRVPLVIRFPPKYAHLAPGKPGTKSDRIVSFIDFAPSILSLAEVPLPGYLQGKPFLGKQQTAAQTLAFAFRGRMDERNDLSRSVRDKKYRYIRNYMPHKRYGQHQEYQWHAASMASWEAAYLAGKLNPVQAAFFQTKPPEELYDVIKDPHNIHNLAGQKELQPVLLRLRAANRKWLTDTKDAGFIPEAMIAQISKKEAVYDYIRGGKFPWEKVLATAEMASEKKTAHLPELTKRLQDPEPVVRYWAALGCTFLGKEAAPAKNALNKLLQDPEVTVQLSAAEALYALGEKETIIPVLQAALLHQNDMVRVQALEVIEAMGPEAAPLLSNVRALVARDSNQAGNDIKVASYLLKKQAAN